MVADALLDETLADPGAVEIGLSGGLRWSIAFEERPAEPADPVFRVVDLVVTHPGSDVMGPQSDILRLRTTSEDRPEIVLSAQWNVVTKFFARPPQIPFGYVGGPGFVPQPFRLLVSSADRAKRFRVKGAQLEGQGFDVGVPEEQPTGDWVVEVKVSTQRRAPGPVAATLVIAIDDEEFPEIRVPLRATVRPAPTK